MIRESGHPIARALRLLITAAAVLIVLWAFIWVASRPLRQQRHAAGKVRITVLHWGDKDEDRIVKDLVRDFEAQPENADVFVKRINLGQAAHVNTKLQMMFAAGDPPDVFYLGFEKVADLAAHGHLADIEELIAGDLARGVPTIDLHDFFPRVVDAFRFDEETHLIGRGKLVALAKDFTTAGFYYNKNLFRQAGIPFPPNDDWTWDEFHAAAAAIGRLPGCHGADFVTWEAMVRCWLWSHGLDFGADDWATLRFNEPAVQASLRKLQQWFFDEERTLLGAKTQLETGQEPFLSGKVGMAGPFGRWKVKNYRTIKGFDWDFAPLPHAAGLPPANGVFTVGWAISRESKHLDESWRFVKYLNSPRAQEQMSRAGLAIPVLRDVANSEAFSNPGQPPENWRAYLTMAEVARPIDWPAAPEYLHRLRVRLEDVFKNGLPIAPALATAERDWQRIRANEALRRTRPPFNWRVAALTLGVPLLALIIIGGAIWWRRRPGRNALREELAGVGCVSPWLIGFVAFTAFPVVLSLLLSLANWNNLTTLDQAQWVGLGNFGGLWTSDETFRRALYVTAWYALLAVPTSQMAALAAALLMAREVRGITVFRAIWYLPSVLAGVGMAIMWKWVFHHENGLLKTLLDPLLGIQTPAILSGDATTWGAPAFAFINLWAIGGTMMIYLAGIKGIPRDLYEAAAIDGATGWRRFRNVTLPMLSPVIFFNVIIAIIASFQTFTQAWVMTAGGPGDATRFYVVYLYNQAFDFGEMGYAAAMAWLLLLLVLGLTLLVMKGSNRFVYYEALKA